MLNARILSIAKKEVLQLVRDRKTLPLILIVPLIQVILFGYVAATEVKNIGFGIYDLDNSALSREIVARVEQSGFFFQYGRAARYVELDQWLDAGKIKIGLVIPAGFEKDVCAHALPRVQVLIDGADPNTASIAQTYFLNIIGAISGDITREWLARLPGGYLPKPPLELRSRVHYNPELRAVNYMVPAITAIILLITTTLLTALSIVREKEAGTVEQIMVTPVKPWEFILGKLLPFPFIGLLEVVLVVGVGALWFGIPIHGSLPLLFFCAALFLLTTLGMGLAISAVSKTQQQAMLSTMFFLIPNILLSGFVFPIANMPKPLQWITYFIPGRYFIEIIRGIYLKGIGAEHLYPQMAALLVLGLSIFGLAVKNFRKKLA
ncbi:MAG: ABC transporter permease [Bacillota bacterium]